MHRHRHLPILSRLHCPVKRPATNHLQGVWGGCFRPPISQSLPTEHEQGTSPQQALPVCGPAALPPPPPKLPGGGEPPSYQATSHTFPGHQLITGARGSFFLNNTRETTTTLVPLPLVPLGACGPKPRRFPCQPGASESLVCPISHQPRIQEPPVPRASSRCPLPPAGPPRSGGAGPLKDAGHAVRRLSCHLGASGRSALPSPNREPPSRAVRRGAGAGHGGLLRCAAGPTRRQDELV